MHSESPSAVSASIPSSGELIDELAEAMRLTFSRDGGAAATLFAFSSLPSTMDWASARIRDEVSLEQSPAGLVGSFGGGTEWTAVLAEEQSAGRGRNNRHWRSQPRAGLYLTIARLLRQEERLSSSLPLVAAVGAFRAASRLGVATCRIKWPNDILAAGTERGPLRKLAGVLIEGSTRGTSSSISIGVGLNLRGDAGLSELGGIGIDECGPGAPDYARSAAILLYEVSRAADRGLIDGFSPFQAEWVSRAAYIGEKGAVVRPHDGSIEGEGTIEGIDEEGSLLLRQDDSSVCRFISGELSLRTHARSNSGT